MRCFLMSLSWNVVCLRVPVLLFTFFSSKLINIRLSKLICLRFTVMQIIYRLKFRVV